jgi:hypothetical protein
MPVNDALIYLRKSSGPAGGSGAIAPAARI